MSLAPHDADRGTADLPHEPSGHDHTRPAQTEHTVPLPAAPPAGPEGYSWPSAPAGQEPAAVPSGASGSSSPSDPPGASGPKGPGRRRLAETAGVALLAAVLASGGTYAVTELTSAPTTAPTAQTQANTRNGTTTSPTVVQGSGTAVDWSTVAGAVAPSVVSINVQTRSGAGAGSGVVYDDKGHILTNNHVVEGAANGDITVTLSDGRTYDASIVGTDPSTDLAVIKLASVPSDLVPITVGDSGQLSVGDPVMAIGNPLGLSGTVTTGIVSALDRPVTTGTTSQSPFEQQGEPVVTNAIQTSAAINPGNSGGALVDASGALIGINSSIAQLGGGLGGQSGNIGIGFAIPVNEAKSIADQLITKGEAEHAYLGIGTRDTTVADGDASRSGALVATVSDGTPAASAGLQQGDVIISIDGDRVESAEALIAQIRAMSAGQQATLTVVRDGARQDVEVTLAAKPAN